MNKNHFYWIIAALQKECSAIFTATGRIRNCFCAAGFADHGLPRSCSTVLCRRSENQGESLEAQSLHKLPSSNFRLPRRPIFALQILQYFLSNNPMALPSSIIMFLLYNTPNSYAIFFFLASGIKL